MFWRLNNRVTENQMKTWSKVTLTLLLALSMSSVGACKSSSDGDGEGGSAAIDTSLPGDAAAGEAIYSRVCFACHGADGRGNGGIGGDFIGTEILNQDNAVLIGSITDGVSRDGRIMPPQGIALSETEIKDALSYVRQSFGGE